MSHKDSIKVKWSQTELQTLVPHLLYIEIKLWDMDPKPAHLLESQRYRKTKINDPISRRLRLCTGKAVVPIILTSLISDSNCNDFG